MNINIEEAAEKYARDQDWPDDHSIYNPLKKGFKAGAEWQLSQLPIEDKPYLKSEYDLQRLKMKALGIDTENQTFEQCVNTVIYMAGGMKLPIEDKEDMSKDVANWQATMWCEVVYATLQADKAGREVGEFIPNDLESKYNISRKAALHQPEDNFGWINVEDRLPDTELAVIITGKYGKNIITCSDTAYYNKDKKKWFDHSNDVMLSDGFVTHWQPLPPPPKASHR